jgi:hypothetical protein
MLFMEEAVGKWLLRSPRGRWVDNIKINVNATNELSITSSDSLQFVDVRDVIIQILLFFYSLRRIFGPKREELAGGWRTYIMRGFVTYTLHQMLLR